MRLSRPSLRPPTPPDSAGATATSNVLNQAAPSAHRAVHPEAAWAHASLRPSQRRFQAIRRGEDRRVPCAPHCMARSRRQGRALRSVCLRGAPPPLTALSPPGDGRLGRHAGNLLRPSEESGSGQRHQFFAVSARTCCCSPPATEARITSMQSTTRRRIISHSAIAPTTRTRTDWTGQ